MHFEIVAQTIGPRHKKGERQNAQTSRAGWRPRKTSQCRLARDIAQSILDHPGRTPEHYTNDPDLIAQIVDALGRLEEQTMGR